MIKDATLQAAKWFLLGTELSPSLAVFAGS